MLTRLASAAADSRVIRRRFTPDDLDSGISEIVTSNGHGDGYAMYAI
jgi:hypothetical protein